MHNLLIHLSHPIVIILACGFGALFAGYIQGVIWTKDWNFLFSKSPVIPSRLYVDDLRPCPTGWIVARNFHEAINLLSNFQFVEVSLDHDIASFYGNKEMTGRDILNWLIARKLDGHYTPPIVRVHSANPVGCETMDQDIKRYWGTP